ncbi:hypothetical protein BGZ96_010664 [Linnemannia gamsii]|uniref:Uncharacterized protein n=1 Tax=Linnemannia gamsii TaxID=64522 RepID=A0ABQ7JU95_9FUNG|nr:hypothetical protein BGZ96_010664 [Linnemannia gamsii]
MKISFLLPISVIMTLAIAETTVEHTLDMNVASDPIVISVEGADVDINHNSDHPPSHSSVFTAWSSPGLKGHKQRTKNTPGCYRLDGGAVGSFEGDPNIQYAFYGDARCSKNMLFASSTAPVRRIDPIVYPRSVKMLKSTSCDCTPDNPNPDRYSLVTWSRPNFAGDNEKYKGMGCIDLDGSIFMSFQGDHHYRFYPGHHCQGPVLLESSGGISSHKRINPRSAFITE